ncbi:DUF2017 domain-containing protein [soil metagenome]
MIGFRAEAEGYTAQFEPDEAAILGELAGQVAELVQLGDPADPVLSRLLPDAYPADAEASAEFRRFTSGGLGERKVRNATTVIGALGTAAAATTSTPVTLSEEDAQAWLRTLTDIRLSLASRLGVTDVGPSGDPPQGLLDLYDWLGFVQESLVRAVDR